MSCSISLHKPSYYAPDDHNIREKQETLGIRILYAALPFARFKYYLIVKK
ncbi:MAG: hypothetical protein JW769_02330 [Parachlamydiales bacterium]|nr:hypothetical protein [Parachlamydiales bacterium]